MMKTAIIYSLMLMSCLAPDTLCAQRSDEDSRVEALMARMTLAEKIGQLNQYNGDWEATGPVTRDVDDKMTEIRQGG